MIGGKEVQWLMPYFTRRRDNIVVEEAFDFVRFNLPQQPFNLQFNLPFPVNTDCNHDGAEENETENAGDNHRQHMAVIFRAKLVVEATLRLV